MWRTHMVPSRAQHYSQPTVFIPIRFRTGSGLRRVFRMACLTTAGRSSQTNVPRSVLAWRENDSKATPAGAFHLTSWSGYRGHIINVVSMNPLSCWPTQARGQCAELFSVVVFSDGITQPTVGRIHILKMLDVDGTPRRRVTHHGSFFSHSEALALLPRGIAPGPNRHPVLDF